MDIWDALLIFFGAVFLLGGLFIKLRLRRKLSKPVYRPGLLDSIKSRINRFLKRKKGV